MQAGSVRLLRITMAFLSVWWLGCQSFDSLAGYLRGSAEVASCMPEMSAAAGASSSGAMPAIADLEQAHECGCNVDCIGIGAPLFASVPLRPANVLAVSASPGHPPEFLAEPLHPPPQL